LNKDAVRIDVKSPRDENFVKQSFRLRRTARRRRITTPGFKHNLKSKSRESRPKID